MTSVNWLILVVCLVEIVRAVGQLSAVFAKARFSGTGQRRCWAVQVLGSVSTEQVSY